MGLKLDNMSSIGTVTRRTMFNPGAGNYDPDYRVSKKKMPAFSMVARHDDSKRFNTPGPGKYENNKSPEKKDAPKFSFGKEAQRGKLAVTNAPGMGIYKIPCQIANLPSYTGARSKDFAFV